MMDYIKQWHKKAKLRKETGILNRMISTELFDHTWIATIKQLEKNLRIRDGQKILEAGSGWGRLIYGLKFYHKGIIIDGYELTTEFVNKSGEILKEANLHNGVRIIQGDLLEVDIPENYYDSFYSARVLHYIQNKEYVIEKLYRSLKNEGKGMIILPNRLCPYRWLTYKHAPLYPINSIGRIMKQLGFKNIKYGGYGFVPGIIRFSYDSFVVNLEKFLSYTPLGKFAGLAFVVGKK